MLLPIRTSEPLDSKKVKPGDYFHGTVAQSVYVGNVLAIPRGATVTGRVEGRGKYGSAADLAEPWRQFLLVGDGHVQHQ
jgi:hypothetical protein